MSALLDIAHLRVAVEGKEVIRDLSLTIHTGELHVLMGPNGSGKSSLALTLMGHPGYKILGGTITFFGKDLLAMKPHERARHGLFLSFQYPSAVPGVSVANLTRTAYKHLHEKEHVDIKAFRSHLTTVMEGLKLKQEFLDRSVNDGFSGGEKKQSEFLQLAMLQPKLAVLDEPDSGLDIDALKRIAGTITGLRDAERAFLLITHYQRLLHHVIPDVVHVMKDGFIVQTGGPELAKQLEITGYEALTPA